MGRTSWALTGLAAAGAVAMAVLGVGPNVERTVEPPTPGVSAAPPAPPLEAPEPELAEWFQRQVIRQLESHTPLEEPGAWSASPGGANASPGNPQPLLSVSAAALTPGGGEALPSRIQRERELRQELARDPDVDWDYLQDVYAGRVSGIPSESKAGASIQEIDVAGEVPYFEELRAEGDTRTLRELGLPEKRNFPFCYMVASERFPVCTMLY